MNTLFSDVHWTNLLIIPGMLLGFTVHELGHSLVAYFLGDRSQVEHGNITLNPFKHISWLGAIAFILTGYFGWPKALQVDPKNLRRQYLDLFLVALSGPIASLTLSLIGLLLSIITASILVYFNNVPTDQVMALLFPLAPNLPLTFNLQALSIAFTGYIFISSFWLTFTSLLPFPGFDGFTIITSLFLYFKQNKAVSSASLTLTNPFALINQHERRNTVAELHFKIGTEFHNDKKYEDAIARYRDALRIDDHFGPAYINMGLAYLAKGNRKEALKAFRSATQYADDPKSKQTGWQQLHLLSEVSVADEDKAQASMASLGANPWTDTNLRPNWLNLGIGSGFFLFTAFVLYGYLFIRLAQFIGG